MNAQRHWGVCPATVLAVVVLCASLAPAAEADKEAIAKLIRQLGDDNYKVRRDAQAKLIEVGEPAIPQLTEALKSSDVEVQNRAEKALAEIRRGAFGRSSEKIAKQIIWELKTSGTLAGPPVTVGDCVVTLSQAGTIRGVKSGDGAEVWKADAKTTCTPAGADGKVYFVDDDGKLRAIDARTGDYVKGFTGPKADGSPAVADGVIYVRSGGDKLLALDAATGKEKWQAELSDKTASSTPPVVGGGRVYAPFGDQGVAAFNAKTGKSEWKVTLGEQNAARRAIDCLFFHDGKVIVRSPAGLRACRADTDGTVWVCSLGGNAAVFQTKQVIVINGKKTVISNSSDLARRAMAVVDGVAYVTNGNAFSAVQLKDGKELWKHELKTDGQARQNGLQQVVVQGGGVIQFAVGGTGMMGAAAATAPAVAAGVAYIGDSKGLHAIDVKTKQELWVLKTEDPVVGAPVISKGVLYFLTAPGMAGGMAGGIGFGGGPAARPAVKGGTLHALRLKKAK